MPAWLLVLFRLTGIFVFAPVLGSRTVPRHVKIFLAMGLSLCVYPMLLAPAPGSVDSIAAINARGFSLWTLGPQVAVELLIGLAIGYSAALPLVGMQLGGYVIDQQVGMRIVDVFNPEMNDESGMLGYLFFLFALAVFVMLGGHRVMLLALVGSFDHVPLGGFDRFGDLVGLVLALLTTMFELAVRISAPLLCLMFLVQVALGFIARTVPQVNILSVGFSLRILVAMAALAFAFAAMGGVYVEVVKQMMRRLMTFFAL